MDYLRSLTKKQWLVILCVIALFALAYFFFFRKTATVRNIPNLETLRQQNTAPRTVEESLNKSEIQLLLKQGRVAPPAEQTRNTMTQAQKDALFKLMSAPRK